MGTSTVILHVNGPIEWDGPTALWDGFGQLLNDRIYDAIVGTEPVWMDGSTGAYLDLTTPIAVARYAYGCAPLEDPIDTLSATNLIAIDVVFELGSTGGLNPQGSQTVPLIFDSAFSELFWGAGDHFVGSQQVTGTSTLLPPVDRGFGWSIEDGPGSETLRDALLGIVNSGNAYIGFAAKRPTFGTPVDGLVRVYEGYVRLTYQTTGKSPRRLYPNRGDGLGYGPTRLYPPPKSRRVAGGIV